MSRACSRARCRGAKCCIVVVITVWKHRGRGQRCDACRRCRRWSWCYSRRSRRDHCSSDKDTCGTKKNDKDTCGTKKNDTHDYLESCGIIHGRRTEKLRFSVYLISGVSVLGSLQEGRPWLGLRRTHQHQGRHRFETRELDLDNDADEIWTKYKTLSRCRSHQRCSLADTETRLYCLLTKPLKKCLKMSLNQVK